MTRDEKIKELKEIVDLEERQIKDKLKEIFRNAVGIDNVGVTCYRDIYRKEIRGGVFIIDKETKEEVFGTEVSYYINERTKCLEINYGSIGSHNSHEDSSAYKYKDILIGEMWKNEDNLMTIYNNIDWTNEIELNNLNEEIYNEERAKRQAEAEEKARQRKIKLDTVLDFIYTGKTVKHPESYRNIYVKKVGTKNVTLNSSIYSQSRWKKYLDKYEFAEFLLDNKYNYMED